MQYARQGMSMPQTVAILISIAILMILAGIIFNKILFVKIIELIGIFIGAICLMITDSSVLNDYLIYKFVFIALVIIAWFQSNPWKTNLF